MVRRFDSGREVAIPLPGPWSAPSVRRPGGPVFWLGEMAVNQNSDFTNDLLCRHEKEKIRKVIQDAIMQIERISADIAKISAIITNSWKIIYSIEDVDPYKKRYEAEFEEYDNILTQKVYDYGGDINLAHCDAGGYYETINTLKYGEGYDFDLGVRDVASRFIRTLEDPGYFNAYTGEPSVEKATQDAIEEASSVAGTITSNLAYEELSQEDKETHDSTYKVLREALDKKWHLHNSVDIVWKDVVLNAFEASKRFASDEMWAILYDEMSKSITSLHVSLAKEKSWKISPPPDETKTQKRNRLYWEYHQNTNMQKQLSILSGAECLKHVTARQANEISQNKFLPSPREPRMPYR